MDLLGFLEFYTWGNKSGLDETRQEKKNLITTVIGTLVVVMNLWLNIDGKTYLYIMKCSLREEVVR